MSGKERNKLIASLKDPTLEAIIAGRFRFGTPAQAVVVMDRIYKNFTISKDQNPIGPDNSPTLKLWISGFAVTDEEIKKGYKGNFAVITIKTADKGKFTLVAEKIVTELKQHPEKTRINKRHPDTGHPILRAATRGKMYPTIEAARQELQLLHEEFPEISIPGADKVHLLVYVRESKPPVKKMTLSIAEVAEGGFKLVLADNVKVKKEQRPLPTASAEPKTVEGKFSSMVVLQQKKKSKAKPAKKETPKPTE